MAGPMSMRLNDAGYRDGRGERETLRALDALAGDVRRAGYAAAAQPPLDVEALADANARRPVVLQVGARQLARTSAEATYDAQNEYQRKVAFAYGGNK